MIKFGPAGNSDSYYEEGYKDTLSAPKWIKDKGLELYEISFGRGITMTQQFAEKMAEKVNENGIQVSIHAPYYINFANSDEERGEQSIQYIINTVPFLKILGGKKIVVHSGTQMKLDRKEALYNIKKRYEKLLEILYSTNNSDIFICPETMGKYSQIGTYEEIFDICKLDKMLIPTLDFGHINCVTQGSLKSPDDYKKIIDKCNDMLGDFKTNNMHIHFSKIEYFEKGEVKHLTFDDEIYGPDFEDLAHILVNYNMTPTIICESKGTMAEDAIKMKEIYKKLLGGNYASKRN